MKKSLIILIIMMLIATTFITSAHAKIKTQNTFFSRNSNGPFNGLIDFFRNIPIIKQIINFFENLFGLEDTSNSETSDETDGAEERSVPSQSDSIKDPTGDILHYRWEDERYGWRGHIGNKPNIDVTEVKYAAGGNKVTISMSVGGTISFSDMVSYHVYLNTSDSHYYFMWMNDDGFGTATSTKDGDFQMSEADITVSGKTITATYNIIGTFSKVEDLWGFAAEYTEYADTSAEWWVDYAPNDESPYATIDSAKAEVSGETPGFELFALIVAFAAIVLVIKRK
ncbi:MAG TPA: Heimdall-CTERM domain-containing surface protein [Candidatus Thermoplasmatota archaeon]|nr:Heimdall-CTERM domain-containing surface protein [Candidatus Thermoplasmatota archaeon]